MDKEFLPFAAPTACVACESPALYMRLILALTTEVNWLFSDMVEIHS